MRTVPDDAKYVVSLLLLTAFTAANAGTVTDNFSTNPYTSRWCNKIQDTVWLSTLQRSGGVCDSIGDPRWVIIASIVPPRQRA
jgi:hypothetical protein